MLTAFIASGCNRDKPGGKSPLAGHNVLLFTLDTIRADHIGCYGDATATTPALDALAARGVLYENAMAQVPLTLPSHGTILTGRFPKEFGVRINNQGAIGDEHPTLATLLKERGYRTAAFVATFVLDARFGLDRGFDHYDDDMINMSMQAQPLEWEQPANIIADRSLVWLEANKSGPFFAWLHFYDPHDPYTPPPPFPKTYRGEVAFMDTQLKRVFDWLDRSGLRDRTLVVVVGDHGESFGEHGEQGHGMFLYKPSLHVPLIFAHPKLTPRPLRVTNTVGAIDVFPTILELYDIPRPEGLMSTSLAQSLRSGTQPPHSVYSESDYVWQTYGWAQQRCTTSEQWKFISSTKPELFARGGDPGEKQNLFGDRRDLAVELSNWLAEFYAKLVAVEAREVAPSADAAAALETLGYVQGGKLAKDEFLTDGVPDPKDMLDVVDRFKDARKLLKQEKYAEAADLLQEVAGQAPNSLAIQAAHGMALVNAGRYPEALDVLENKARALDANHQPVLINIGDAYFMMNDFEKSRSAFTLAVENDPLDPTARYKLGKSFLRLNQPEPALAAFAEAARLFPDFAEAHFELATLLAARNQLAQAVDHFRISIRLKPDQQQAHYNLGRALLLTGQFGPAGEHLNEAARLKPDDGLALINLGIAWLSSGRWDEGKKALQQATLIPASAVEAHLNLAIAARKENDAATERRHYERVLEIAPGHPDAQRELARLSAAP
jgi:arylsulfatase A-like enzyme/tetratricopeptide (TPR) repeat protein